MDRKYGETSRSGGAHHSPIGYSKEEKKESFENGRKVHVQKSPNVEAKEEDQDDIEVLQRARLDISSKPLPPIEGLIEALSQLNNLQRLDMSDMKTSTENDNPNGLETLQWLGKAVAKSKSRNKTSSSVFGQQLTWLKFSDNPSLGKYAGENAWLGLDRFSKLTVLNAASCDLPVPPPTSTLLAWQSLGALVLGHNTITSISHFPSMPQLNTIVLSHNQIKSLPLDMPANLPSLKKLSITHNKLRWSNKQSPLPDFSLCSHLREVRISGNVDLKRLPNHLRNWGKGVGKDSKGTGLETFEAGDCGLDDWTSIAPLMEASDDSQNENGAKATDAIHPSRRRRIRGLTTLSLRGNEVTKSENYQEKIFKIHSGLRVLDSVKLQADQKKGEEEAHTNLDRETLKSGHETSYNPLHKSVHSSDPSQKKQSDIIDKIGHEKSARTLRSSREEARPLRTNGTNEKSRKTGKEEAFQGAEIVKSTDRDPVNLSAKDKKLPDRSKDFQKEDTIPEETRKKQHKRGGRGKKKKSTDDGEKEEAEHVIRDPFLLPVEKSAKNTRNEDEHLARIRARAGPAIADGSNTTVKKKKKGGVSGSGEVDIKVKKTKPQKAPSLATSDKHAFIDSQNSKKRKAWDEDTNDAEETASQKRGKKEDIPKQSIDAEPVSKELTSVSGIVNVEKNKKKNRDNQNDKGKVKVPFNVARKSQIGKTSEPSIGLGGAWN